MWVKVTDPFTKAALWVNLDAVAAMRREMRDSWVDPANGLTVEAREVTRLFCAHGTIDCAELPEQVLACSPEAGRHVLPKTVPVVPKSKGRR